MMWWATYAGSVRIVSRFDRLKTTLRRLDPLRVDAAAAAVLGVLVVATAVSRPGASLVVPAGLLLCGAVVLRRRAPVAATLLAGASATAVSRAADRPLVVAPVVLALVYYSLGRRRPARGSSWVDAVLLALPVAVIATDPATPSPGDPLIIDVLSVWGFFIVLPFVAGRAIGSRSGLNAELRASAERLEERQRARARQAVVDERTRIARELHDVVAHSVSVMVVQTAAARAVAPRDPSAAAEALRSVERCGEEALTDMRRMIGVLHRADFDVLGGATPGLAQLDKLAERAGASGLPVQVSVHGEPRPLAPGLDLVSFRVVQEALTNAIKHAGPARAHVQVTYTPNCLELEIADTGLGPPRQRTTDSPGQGLLGMRERLSLYGGQLATGHRRGGGFQVLARIPLTEPVST
jgi:signal transduction histidine kinase